MTSLSRKLKLKQEAKRQDNIVDIEDIKGDVESPPESPPKLVRQIGIDKTERQRNILFVSDSKITPNIKAQLADYSNIYQYDRDLFSNRSCSDLLLEHDCQHLWVNLFDKHGRQWLGKTLLNNDIYYVVAVIGNSKQQKWIEDIKDHIDLKCKVSELNKLKSLTYGELMDNLGSLEIHPPIGKLLSCLGLGNGKLTKKKS